MPVYFMHYVCSCLSAAVGTVMHGRIRPAGATGDMSPSCVDVGVDGDLAIYDVQSGTRRMFKVDRVFNQEVGQDKVYEDTQPLIRSVLDGTQRIATRACSMLLAGLGMAVGFHGMCARVSSWGWLGRDNNTADPCAVLMIV